MEFYINFNRGDNDKMLEELGAVEKSQDGEWFGYFIEIEDFAQLEEFENDNKFLDTQISQRLLSENFSTNATYLSKIINVYKGKTFNIYINDLRLDYIIEFLKNDVKYLNMDVKELARLSGFSNTENFSDNFQRKFKIKPSYFIKMMKENISNS